MAQYKPLQKHSPSRERWSSTWWWWEIISVIASLFCIIAVVVILRMMQDQPVDHWTFFVSLNAVIAIFITAAKSTAMLSVAACIGQWKWVYFTSKSRKLSDIDVIEEATRGPLGSLQMIATIPWSWATLGAIVTILALGIDTFAQQVISTEAVTDWVNDGTSNFKIVHDYITNVRTGAGGDIIDTFNVDTSMQGAVVKAFYNLDSPPIFSCPSNCTWNQTFTSLGFSTSCVNVTQATYATQECTNGTLPKNCTMTTPGNVTFSTAIISTTWSTVLVIKARSLIGDGREAWFNPIPRPPANFVRLAIFRQPSEYRGGSDGALEQTLECDISLAAYQYSNTYSIANNFTFGRMEKIELERGYITGPDSSPTILFNTTGLPEFRVSMMDLAALRDYFTSDSFSGTLVDGESIPTYSQGITAAIRNPQTNISSLLESMGTSMTDQLRTSPNATVAPGFAAKSVLLVRIQWVWLSLPFFVVLASAAFLIAEMAESRRSKEVMLWKSTATSMLFHSVLPAEGVVRMQFESPKQLQEAIKTTRVRLERL